MNIICKKVSKGAALGNGSLVYFEFICESFNERVLSWGQKR